MKKSDPEALAIRAMWRAFMRIPDEGRRAALRWFTERYWAEEAAKKRDESARAPDAVDPSAGTQERRPRATEDSSSSSNTTLGPGEPG